MKYARVSVVVVFALGLLSVGCSKSTVAEGPKQEYVSKSVLPAKVETKSESLVMTIEGLKVNWTEDTGNHEIVGTPSLRGSYKLVNTSKDVLEVQGVTIEYTDNAGKPIAFQSGEKTAKASLMFSALKPQESSEGTLDVIFPRAALKSLDKIRVNVVYIPSPLKSETLTLSGKVEG